MSPSRPPDAAPDPAPVDAVRELCARGDRHLGAGDLAAAVRDYHSALELDPNHARAHHNLGVVYYKLGRFAEAGAEIDRAIELSPDTAELYFTRGLIHKDSREHEQALRCFDEALMRAPESVQALRYRGNVHFELGENDEAISDFERVLELSPREPGVAYDLAIAHADAQHWGPAEQWFLKAAEGEPDNADIYYNLGLAHARDVSTPDSEAEAAFRKVLELAPDHLGARFRLGVLYAKAKYRDPSARANAVRELKALTEAPDFERLLPEAHLTWFALGTLYDDHEETAPQAAECYARCLELRPDFAPAFNNRGIILQRGGRPAEAASCFRQAIEADPDYAGAYHNFCELCYDQPKELLEHQLEELIAGEPRRLADIILKVLLEFVDTARASAYEDTYQKIHQVKNLVAVLGARLRTVEGMVQEHRDGEPAERDVGQLLSLHESIFESLRAYLAALHKQQPRFEIVTMCSVVARGIQDAKARQPPNVTVRLECGSHVPEIRGDGDRLREAISNLIHNAFEALAADGGELLVRVEPILPVAGRRGASAQGVRVIVSDTGPGMTPAERQRALRPGFTTKPRGSGYGLAIAAQIARQHNGAISIDSAPGEGTTVTLELPLNLDVEKEQSRMRLRPVIFEDSKRLIQTEFEEF